MLKIAMFIIFAFAFITPSFAADGVYLGDPAPMANLPAGKTSCLTGPWDKDVGYKFTVTGDKIDFLAPDGYQASTTLKNGHFELPEIEGDIVGDSIVGTFHLSFGSGKYRHSCIGSYKAVLQSQLVQQQR